MTVQVLGGVYAGAVVTAIRSNCWVRLYELTNGVEISIPDDYTAACTPDQARALARQLYRLARRVDARNLPTEEKT